MGCWVCQRSGNCCRWKGFVKLSNQDISRISKFLFLSEEQFIEEYTQLAPNRKYLILNSRENDDCTFLKGKNICTIHEVKPNQCLGFPNKWMILEKKNDCKAIYVDE